MSEKVGGNFYIDSSDSKINCSSTKLLLMKNSEVNSGSHAEPINQNKLSFFDVNSLCITSELVSFISVGDNLNNRDNENILNKPLYMKEKPEDSKRFCKFVENFSLFSDSKYSYSNDWLISDFPEAEKKETSYLNLNE